MKVRTTQETSGVNGPIPAGTEIERADAYRLCEIGVAEPVDDEAQEMLDKYQEWQQKHRDKVAAQEAARDEAAKQDRLRTFEKRLSQGKV